MEEGVTFALLHSLFLGPLTWDAVASELAERGSSAQIIDYRSAIGTARAYYGPAADAVARGLRERSVLVAHSAAGGMVPSVISAAEGRVAAVLFADALLPHPGRSWLDTAPEPLRTRVVEGAAGGRARPWPALFPGLALEQLISDAALRSSFVRQCAAVPLLHLQEVAPAIDLPVGFPAGYVQFSSGYDDEARRSSERGWGVKRLNGDHLWPITHPVAVADALVCAAKQLSAA
jgi:hypothetical protein